MTLEEHLDYLDRQFDFRSHPEKFDFNLSPERFAYRNEALRKSNRDIYAAFLADRFPENMSGELQKFDNELHKLRHLSKEDAENIFLKEGINLLQSDFNYRDPDAIYKKMKVASEDLSWHLQDSDNDILHGKISPNTALANQESIWLLD